MMEHDEDRNPKSLRVIKTARTEKAINQAALKGFLPLVRHVKPSKKIHSKFCVWQNLTTGEIDVVGDFRCERFDIGWRKVIDWTDYYPHSFPEPFAAYLIPRDLAPGERVFLEDLIEDFVGMSWNQGDAYRLESCEAVWDGTELKISYEPSRDRRDCIG